MARCFHLTDFWVFVSIFVALKGPSEIIALLVNLGNGILLILRSPNSLTSRRYFLQ